MSLCEHCACRGSWDCEDGYYCSDLIMIRCQRNRKRR